MTKSILYFVSKLQKLFKIVSKCNVDTFDTVKNGFDINPKKHLSPIVGVRYY